MKKISDEHVDFTETRRKSLFCQKSARVASSYFRRVAALGNLPESAQPFLDVLKQVFIDFQPVSILSERKTVGTFCLMVPPELVEAAGAAPVRLCSGSYTAYSIGDGLAPRDACPLVKAVLGMEEMAISPLYRDCALFVIPATCDCKKKLAGLLEERRPTAILPVPSSKERDADTEQFLQELYRLVPVLEQHTGGCVTAKTLADSINRRGYAQYEMARFLTFRRNVPYLLYGTQAMAVMNALSYMPALEWARCLHGLNEELAARLAGRQFAAKGNRPRILVTGSPITFPNIKIPLLIEEMGGMLVADETCMGERSLYDPLVITDRSLDGMMRALANRYIRPCTCPSFVENCQRIFRIRQMVKDYQVQGIICHILRGCLVYDYEYQMLEEELEKLRIPVIRVESDYNEEDVEQLRIRIEAFIEMLKLREFARKKEEMVR
ncbi:MAG: 2-hydroxyacyl-CoA dehydratase family protein [Clostridiales bacterium]|nr:2-hydroxyacyl-CoA dehydratase family protein [Clostridiales bacterium]